MKPHELRRDHSAKHLARTIAGAVAPDRGARPVSAMLLDRTILQLDTGPMPPEEARQMGQLGYLQWLICLPDGADYRRAARAAEARAAPFAGHSPAVAAFCALLRASVEDPLTPLDLAMPPRRRGGAAARRATRLPF